MTAAELALTAILAFAGFISLLLLLVLVAASIVQREVEEYRFRAELREAIERDASSPQKPARPYARTHQRRFDLQTLPHRRGDR